MYILTTSLMFKDIRMCNIIVSQASCLLVWSLSMLIWSPQIWNDLNVMFYIQFLPIVHFNLTIGVLVEVCTGDLSEQIKYIQTNAWHASDKDGNREVVSLAGLNYVEFISHVLLYWMLWWSPSPGNHAQSELSHCYSSV